MLQNPRAFAARSAAGRPARKISGSVSAVMSGTLSTQVECAQPAFANGLTLNASVAAVGRRIRPGTRSDGLRCKNLGTVRS